MIMSSLSPVYQFQTGSMLDQCEDSKELTARSRQRKAKGSGGNKAPRISFLDEF